MSRTPFSIQVRRLVLCSVALGAAAPAAGTQSLPPVRNDIAQRALACMACHGQHAAAEKTGFFPRLAGKPSGYLYNQLINFRDGRRRYPAMNVLLTNLSDDYLREMAEYFSTQQLPYPPARAINATAAIAERGRRLVMQGDRARNIPACAACHGPALTGAAPAIPGLLGLPRDYLNAQFGAWKTGARRASAPDCMQQVSRLLQPVDVEAVTVWLASQKAPVGTVARAPAGATLPLPCGSVSQ